MKKLLRLMILLGFLGGLTFFAHSPALQQFLQKGTHIQEENTVVHAPTSTQSSTSRVATTTNTTLPPATSQVSKVSKTGTPSVALSKTPPKSSVSTPGPLTSLVTTPEPSPKASSSPDVGSPSGDGALNPKDITLLTNNERNNQSLPSLTFNKRLSAMAEAKAADMINKQYFAHVAPDGTDIAKLADTYGYQYLNIGENLALGDFKDSADVVLGWMNSPGHRANILNTHFTEIGVAAVLGNYQGRLVWYSVQEFGRPLPDCVKPNSILEQKISLYQSQISMTETTLLHLREEIDADGIDQATYREKVKDYNTIVTLYNTLVATVKSDIATYNQGVNAYNVCIGS